MESNFTRREWLSRTGKVIIGVAVVGSGGLITTGCGPAVLATVRGLSLSRVLWGAVRTRARVAAARNVARRKLFQPRASSLVVKGLVEAGQQYLFPEVSSSDMRRLEAQNAPLTIEDGDGVRFENTPYGVYQDLGIVQSCYSDEPRYLFEGRSFNSRRISELRVGEEVGVFNKDQHTNGWYRVQTVNREEGWVHGNCLVDFDLIEDNY